MGVVDVMMAREMFSEKEARASAEVGGATGRGATVMVETEAIVFEIVDGGEGEGGWMVWMWEALLYVMNRLSVDLG